VILIAGSPSCGVGTQQRLGALEAKEAYDSPQYQNLMLEEVYPLMICRTKP
jgi:proline iminopeptidase